jgi:hypothetical protein
LKRCEDREDFSRIATRRNHRPRQRSFGWKLQAGGLAGLQRRDARVDTPDLNLCRSPSRDGATRCTLRSGWGTAVMILAKLAAATLTVGVAMGPGVEGPVQNLSLQQKNAATRVYVRPVTDCIAGSVVSDARFRSDDPAANLGDLIVDAVPKCLGPVRAMIAAYDRYFGEGSGEEFFMGPYLDVLPNILVKKMKTVAE